MTPASCNGCSVEGNWLCWFHGTELDRDEDSREGFCAPGQHCEVCNPNGDCERCGTIDGRSMEVVNEYASTCDGCGELAMHEAMEMDPKTQFGYCEDCVRLRAKTGIE